MSVNRKRSANKARVRQQAAKPEPIASEVKPETKPKGPSNKPPAVKGTPTRKQRRAIAQLPKVVEDFTAPFAGPDEARVQPKSVVAEKSAKTLARRATSPTRKFRLLKEATPTNKGAGKDLGSQKKLVQELIDRRIGEAQRGFVPEEGPKLPRPIATTPEKQAEAMAHAESLLIPDSLKRKAIALHEQHVRHVTRLKKRYPTDQAIQMTEPHPLQHFIDQLSGNTSTQGTSTSELTEALTRESNSNMKKRPTDENGIYKSVREAENG
jgi:hypothetical protein